jgi:hypothetical protein
VVWNVDNPSLRTNWRKLTRKRVKMRTMAKKMARKRSRILLLVLSAILRLSSFVPPLLLTRRTCP